MVESDITLCTLSLQTVTEMDHNSRRRRKKASVTMSIPLAPYRHAGTVALAGTTVVVSFHRLLPREAHRLCRCRVTRELLGMMATARGLLRRQSPTHAGFRLPHPSSLRATFRRLHAMRLRCKRPLLSTEESLLSSCRKNPCLASRTGRQCT